jgi:hypothetical protein
MWNMKCMIIPVITGVTEIVKKGYKQKFVSHTRKTLNRVTTKTAILVTSHMMLKVLQSETSSLRDGDHSWLKRRSTKEERSIIVFNIGNSFICTLNSNYRVAATLYSLEIGFV